MYVNFRLEMYVDFLGEHWDWALLCDWTRERLQLSDGYFNGRARVKPVVPNQEELYSTNCCLTQLSKLSTSGQACRQDKTMHSARQNALCIHTLTTTKAHTQTNVCTHRHTHTHTHTHYKHPMLIWEPSCKFTEISYSSHGSQNNCQLTFFNMSLSFNCLIKSGTAPVWKHLLPKYSLHHFWQFPAYTVYLICEQNWENATDNDIDVPYQCHYYKIINVSLYNNIHCLQNILEGDFRGLKKTYQQF